jgi:hypothetical protein
MRGENPLPFDSLGVFLGGCHRQRRTPLFFSVLTAFNFGRREDFMLTGIPKDLLAKIELHGMPVSELAVCAGRAGIRNASKTKLNECFRGAASMPNDTAEQLWSLWQEIEQLMVALHDVHSVVTPLALDLRDGSRVFEWIVAQRKGLWVKVVGPDTIAM